jgi:hypothetical protein
LLQHVKFALFENRISQETITEHDDNKYVITL